MNNRDYTTIFPMHRWPAGAIWNSSMTREQARPKTLDLSPLVTVVIVIVNAEHLL